MYHHAVKSYQFQRKMGVHVLDKVYPRTLAGLYRESRVYGGLMDIRRSRLWLKIF